MKEANSRFSKVHPLL